MPDYIEPQQSDYSDVEQSVLDIMSTKYPSLVTKAGSVIRELIVRPVSYVYSWVMTNMRSARKESSIGYLMTSQLTENEVADDMASNFFVTRRDGTRSKGKLSLILDRPYILIPAMSAFHIGDAVLYNEMQISAIDDEYREVDGTLYVPVVPIGNDEYMITIPVVASTTGPVDIPRGAELETGLVRPMTGGFLASDVTGGSERETDAEMMRRASYSTAQSGIGSVYGIKMRLAQAPISVLDMSVLSEHQSKDAGTWNNTAAVKAGGSVDCYVKTDNSMEVDNITFPTIVYAESVTEHVIRIGTELAPAIAGLYAISDVFANGSRIRDFSVAFESADGDTAADASAARLSDRQVAVLSFNTDEAVTELNLTITALYADGIRQLQLYMDSDVNKFIGQHVMIKAAVPVALSIDCVVDTDTRLDDTVLQSIREVIARTVCGMPVGRRHVNFSDLREAVASVLPDVKLRLPCTISADIPLRNGKTTAMCATSGLLEIPDTQEGGMWDPAVYYFSLLTTNVRLEQA